MGGTRAAVIPLSKLLEAPLDGERPVAFGSGGARDLADLRRDVAELAAELEPVAGRPLLLHCEDAYAFAVGLLAGVRVGARVLLAPSRQPGVLARLAPEVAVALLDVDEPPESLGATPHRHRLQAAAAGGLPPRALDREAPLATLFTSGTTGPGARVEKALRHVEDEIAWLEQRFGAELGGGARILTTVSPQHLYGLLFRVLWPLCAGRPFLRVAALHPEELAPHAAEAPFAVVTTPLALRHLAARGALGRRGESCRAIFCSAGPLTAEGARAAAAALGRTPWEIYGSSETGGVACRQQRKGDEPWQPFAGVALEVDPASGCAAVSSPFVSAGAPAAGGLQRFVTGDQVELGAAGRFRLLGRADRVVKVGEKRISLADLESRLAEHPAVGEAAVLPLDGAAGETRIGAVVAPSAAAWDTLETGGQRALAKLLSEFLAADFDRIFLPRAWRFAAGLPRDAQGKLPVERLLPFFAAERAPVEPECSELERSAGRLVQRLRVPWNLAFLEGHFPGRPVVAGVVQLGFAMRALEALLGRAPALERLEALKFHALLAPGDEATLVVELAADRAGFRFRLEDAARPERLFASGRGRLAAR